MLIGPCRGRSKGYLGSQVVILDRGRVKGVGHPADISNNSKEQMFP